MNSQLQLGLDRHAELDRRVRRVLEGRVHHGLSEWQLELLRILAAHKGRENAISIRRLLDQFGYETDLVINEREIKATVKELVERFDIYIGAAREKPYGYFLVVTVEDQADAVRPLKNEIKSLAKRIRKLSGKRFLAELLRQLQLDLDAETNPPQTHGGTEAA